jgi:Ca-activated chloride channel family protein
MRSLTYRLSAVLLVLVTAPSLALLAQGWIEPMHPLPSGGIVRVRSAVAAAVTGRVARVTVEEWFQNRGPGLGEGMYLYPLPGEAVFSSFSLWQGDQELRGETMDAGQARAIYEDIVRRKRDPALIELAGHGLVRARVFPINPGETRKITLRYTQVLDRVGDAWRLRYPAGPGAAPRSIRVVVDSGARFGEPYSPTHQVRTTRRNDQLEITLADSSVRGGGGGGSEGGGGGDLEVFLPLAHGLVGMSLLTHHPAGEDGYFMLLLAPGTAHDAAAVHRDVVAVLDISGSMSGEKIEQARGALVQLLGTLRDGDRFRLIAFSSGVRRFRVEWTPVSAESRREAEQWIRALEAEGGTNIAGALAEAFSATPREGALGVVVFLTDGLPTIGESDPERIVDAAERHRGAFRVFAFGIGDDVNTYLLDRLTERARGVTEYIRPGADIEATVGDLAAKIASPVLTDLALAAGPGLEVYDAEPEHLPDLFAGDEMVVFGRYRGAMRGGEETDWSVTVRGRRGGREEQFSTTTRDRENADARYIEQLWAARKAGRLSQEIRLRGQNPEIMRELRDLALRYGILTDYTSYLVQEPGVLARRGDPVPVMSPPPRPVDQAGAGQIAKAEEQAALQSSVHLDAVVVTGAAEAADSVIRTRRSRGAPAERIGARLFLLKDSVWMDTHHGDSLRVVTVAPFSPAYFSLLRALPELVQPAGLQPAVLVAGRRVSVKIQEGGLETWGAGELTRVVREFR